MYKVYVYIKYIIEDIVGIFFGECVEFLNFIKKIDV